MAVTLKKISDVTNTIYTTMAVAAIISIVFACTVQVVVRYVFNSAFSWTEELARYSFVWATMCGSTIATKKVSHATMDFIVQKFRGSLRKTQQTVINLVIMGICVLFIVQSIPLLKVTSTQLSVGMRIPLMYIYLAVPVGAVGHFIHALSHFVSSLLPQGETGDSAGVAR